MRNAHNASVRTGKEGGRETNMGKSVWELKPFKKTDDKEDWKYLLFPTTKHTATASGGQDPGEASEGQDPIRIHFLLARYKNEKTHEERLEIESFLDEKPNGTITTDLMSLDGDVRKFARFGVPLSGIEFFDMSQTIRKNYLRLTPNEEDIFEFYEVLDAVWEYVNSKDQDHTGAFYNIPVDEFGEILKKLNIERNEIPRVRSNLSACGYIKHGQGRYSRLEKIGGKAKRVISFNKKELESFEKKQEK
jgi:DNA-directed RNA polymerase subunit H (RpoH/RPB5)